MVEKLERYIDAVSTTSLVPAESIRCPNGHGPACVTAVELTNNLRMRHEDDFDPKIVMCSECPGDAQMRSAISVTQFESHFPFRSDVSCRST